ncbi:MAG: hypothetical protein ACOCQ4_01370 [bacterium]
MSTETKECFDLRDCRFDEVTDYLEIEKGREGFAGTLDNFLRLPRLDLSDDHSHVYPLLVNAYTEERFHRPMLMTLWDRHLLGDFGSVEKIPPELSESAYKHQEYTRENLHYANHIAPTMYRLGSSLIVVYPQETITTKEKSSDLGETVFYRDLSLRHVKGESCVKDNSAINIARLMDNKPLVDEELCFSQKEYGEKIRDLRIFFTRITDYPKVLQYVLEETGEEEVVNNIDFDYFFYGKQNEKLTDEFLEFYPKINKVKPSTYNVGCTSTNKPSFVEYAHPEDVLQVIQRVGSII